MNQIYNPASFGKRLVAFIIDLIIVNIISSILTSALGIDLFAMASTTDPEELTNLFSGNFSLYWILSILLGFGYYVVLAYFLKGATVGKLLLGLRVVTDGEDSISFGKLLGREIIGKELLGAVTCGITYLISLFMVAFGADKKSIHDKLFGTLVIDAKSPQNLPDLKDE